MWFCPYLFYKGMILMSKTKRLQTIDGESLMSLPLTPLNFVVDTLLSQGLHILAGSPKVGKSWLALWLSVMVAKGEAVWGMSVQQGTTLYLCLEDSTLRIQNRLFEITEDVPANVHFTTQSDILGKGLEEQLRTFLDEHPDTVLVIIDTLQMVRPVRDATYANDYRDLSVLKQIADAHGIAILLIHHLRKETSDDVFNRISGTTAISGAVDSSFTLVEERRGSGRAKLSCIGRDIEYRELTLERNGENVWELVADSQTQPELLGDRIVYLLSELMRDRTEFIGTPTELSERIDPLGVERISPKKVSRQILQNLDALRKIGISAVVRRSNGRRLIELQRAESDDTQGVPAVDPVDPAGALCGDLRARRINSRKAKETPCWAACGRRRSAGVRRGRITSLEVASIAFVWSPAQPPPAFRIISGQKPGPTLSTVWRKPHEKRYQVQHSDGIRRPRGHQGIGETLRDVHERLCDRLLSGKAGCGRRWTERSAQGAEVNRQKSESACHPGTYGTHHGSQSGQRTPGVL